MKKTFREYLRIPFVQDLAKLQLGRFVSIASGFLASIVSARLLGVQGFGEYSVALIFTGTVGLLTNLGQEPTTLTFFAEAYGEQNRTKMTAVMRYYILYSLAACGLLALLALLSPWITLWLYGSMHIGRLAGIVFLSSICEFAFTFLLIVLQTVRRIGLLTILENTKTLLQLCSALALLMLGWGVSGMLLSFLIASSLFALVSIVLLPILHRSYGLPTFMEALSTKSSIKPLMRDGLWIAIDKNLGNLYPDIFLLLLSVYVNAGVVGLVRMGIKLADMPSSFVLANISRLSSSVIPTIVGRDKAAVGTAIRSLFTHTLLVHLLVTIAALICVPIFLPYVYGPAFAGAVYPFVVVVIVNLSLGLHALITPILRIYSKVHYAALFNAAGTLVGVGLFYTLLPLTRPTLALYSAITAYMVLIGFVAVPTWRLLRKTA